MTRLINSGVRFITATAKTAVVSAVAVKIVESSHSVVDRAWEKVTRK